LCLFQSEKEEEKAIKKILEESRQPLKCQEKSSACDEKTGESRRRHYSSSDSNSDSSDDYHKRSKRRRRSRDSRSKSRSRSRNRRRKRDKRSRTPSLTREDGELDTSESSDSDRKKEGTQRKRKKKNKKANDYEGRLGRTVLAEMKPLSLSHTQKTFFSRANCSFANSLNSSLVSLQKLRRNTRRVCVSS
jgi:hypothetical protein